MKISSIPALLMLSSALQLVAQPTITNADRPQAGDECPYLYSSDPFYLALGPDVVWDLTLCSFTPSGTQYYVQGNTAPGSTHFPFDDLALTDEVQSFYEFYNMTTTTWDVVGVYFPDDDSWVTLTDPWEVMHYPCTYGDQWTDEYTFVWSDDPTEYSDTSVMDAAAYGTLLLPGVMVSDVLGVLQEQEDIDAFGDGWIDQTLYLYQHGTNCMVGRLSTSTFYSGGSIADMYFNARVLDDASIGMQEVADAGALEIWPVPTNGTLNLHWPGAQGAMDATVVDATGRVVLEQHIAAAAGQTTINVAGLPTGTYLLRLADNTGLATTRAFQVE